MTAQNAPQYVVEIEEPETGITVYAEPDSTYIARSQEASQQRRAAIEYVYDAIWAPDWGTPQKKLWNRYWIDEHDRWLGQQDSPHTQRAYKASLKEFFRYMEDAHAIEYPWMVESRHIVAWIDQLKTVGGYLAVDGTQRPLAERSIGRHLAACSAFYKHMCDCTQMHEGEQVGLYVSRSGRPLQNPFSSSKIKRPAPKSYEGSKAIPTAAMRWILEDLGHKAEKSLSDYRDFALLLTFYRTGYRAASVLSMRWSDFEERTDGKPGAIFAWRGKGGKSKNKAIPAMIHNAIVAYLKASGRWVPGHEDHIRPEDYVWRPLRLDGCANFTNVDALDANRAITQSTANGILQRHLRRYFAFRLRQEKHPASAIKAEAGRLAKRYHLHSIRHTFASEMAEASGDNILLIQELMDHESPETTRIYIAAIKNPQDKATDLLQARFGY
jgi:site-specific recombinase XerD